MNDLDEVTGLIREHAGTKYRKTLTCAQDAADAVASVSAPAAPRQPWEANVALLTGIEVVVIGGYVPGRWKMTRHDHCDVIGGDGIDQAMIVTHKDCAVLGEGVLDHCSRCDAVAVRRTGDLCLACGPDVPLCQPCYDLHAGEIKDGEV